MSKRADGVGVVPSTPVAWGLFAYIDGEGWVLQFPVRATQRLAEGDKAMYASGTKLQVLPLTAGVPATEQRSSDSMGKLISALQFVIRHSDSLTPSDIQRMQAILAEVGGKQ